MSVKLSPLSLSFWMAGAENTKLAQAAYQWFTLLGKAAAWAIDKRDPLTCGQAMLDLLAWERGVTRTRFDSERLYRLRVKHAYENAADAGSVNGWKRIFERLELLPDGSEIEQLERMAGQDWDIVGLRMSDERMAELQNILERIIIEEYGRTCRRYLLVSRVKQGIAVSAVTFDDDNTTILCRSNILTEHRAGEILA
jgi:P2-related tail formation protein